MKGFIKLIVFFYLFSAGKSLADENLYNPLLSYREQLKNLKKDCKERKYDKDCANIEKKLGDEMEKIKEICKTNPNDERCGAVMKERKVNILQTFCIENPHAKKCVSRRMSSRRREKMKRLFCTKNPDASRCQTRVKDRGKQGFGYFCKLNPQNKRCVAYLEKKAMSAPQKEPESHGF